MILQLLTGIHNLTTLLFGIFISAFFLGVKPSMKNFGKLLLFALVDVFFYWGINLFTGTEFANQLYPVLVHLPLILFLFLCYRYSLLSCCISVFSAYLCCQFSNWIGLFALTLTKNPVWYYSTRIAMTFITFFFLFKFVRRTTQTIFSSAFLHLFIIFLIMPQRNFPIFCTPEIKSLLNLWDLLLVSAISFFCLYTLRNPRRNRKSASTATEWKCS